MTSFVLLNGEFVEAARATVCVHDGGWLHGAGLFETMRAENGRVFRLDSHLRRLRASAEKLLRPVEDGLLPSADQLGELLSRNGASSARIRLTLTAGSMLANPGGSNEETARLTVCTTVSPLGTYPAALYDSGVGVVISKYRQSPDDPLAGHKTTSHLSRLLGLREAHAARCTEALWFTTRNELAEGSISNVFVVRDGVLMTPPTDTPVLPGIARSVALELAGEMGIPAQEKKLHIADLLDADEVLLTNAVMQVMPVIRVEQRDIGGGKIGSTASRLRRAYRERVEWECAPS